MQNKKNNLDIHFESLCASNLTSKLKDHSYLRRLFWEPEQDMNVSNCFNDNGKELRSNQRTNASLKA